jgi:hypothetical protein
MPSAAFEQELMMTFTQDIPYMNSLNLMSTIATQVKVLSTQVHSDRINQFDLQQHCIQMEI